MKSRRMRGGEEELNHKKDWKAQFIATIAHVAAEIFARRKIAKYMIRTVRKLASIVGMVGGTTTVSMRLRHS